eukprot:CAMPEP_0197524460 /NCGR_PEP_ID=MMETSP1318-20131121/9137_1 /TAXON_ID=552666 /ORGANISM="Partenskyella glossopodia, Strain RCC365" /LENGTH=138 /DNA_ID=CAMNT_0043077429 /DNA_START=447 /DNA_END=866 /DNA_ORIENTATION=-
MIQSCVGIAEVHIVTKSQQKFSIIGLKDPETFVNTVTRYARSPGEAQNVTKTEPMEMTLQQRADRAEEKRDVAALSQLDHLEDLSVDQLDALDKKLVNLDRRLSQISDTIQSIDNTSRRMSVLDGDAHPDVPEEIKEE